MYTIESRIAIRNNQTIWMPYKQYRTHNGVQNFQKRHQYLFDAGELRVTGDAEPRQSHTKSDKGLLRAGDILHESYGYDMTINEFYEVIALSPSGKTIFAILLAVTLVAAPLSIYIAQGVWQ